jgi:hypothetical protein
MPAPRRIGRALQVDVPRLYRGSFRDLFHLGLRPSSTPLSVFSWRADSGGLGGDGFAGEFGELVGGDGELFGEGLPFYEG